MVFAERIQVLRFHFKQRTLSVQHIKKAVLAHLESIVDELISPLRFVDHCGAQRLYFQGRGGQGGIDAGQLGLQLQRRRLFLFVRLLPAKFRRLDGALVAVEQ